MRNVSISSDGRWAVSGSDDKTLRVWDLDSGVCAAIYLTESEVTSISEIRPGSYFVHGTHDGKVTILIPQNLHIELSLATAVRIWLYGEKGNKAQWDNDIITIYPWCGQRYPVSDEILDVIRSISRDANLSLDQSLCLELSTEVWDESLLFSSATGHSGLIPLSLITGDRIS